MELLKLLIVFVLVKLSDSHHHLAHHSILDASFSGILNGVGDVSNKVQNVAAAVVGSIPRIPGFNLNFQGNADIGGSSSGHHQGGGYRPQNPSYNKPQKKPDKVVVVFVEERPSSPNGQETSQYPHPGAPNYPGNSNHQGNNPNPCCQQNYPSNNNNYQPNVPNRPNNNYQPNYPPNNYQPPQKPSHEYQPDYPNYPQDNFKPPGYGPSHQQPSHNHNNNYRPPHQQNNNYQPPNQQNNNYQPPHQQNNNFQPPYQQNNNYQPPNQQSNNYQPPNQQNNNYRPPHQQGNNYQPPHQQNNNYKPYSQDDNNHGGFNQPEEENPNYSTPQPHDETTTPFSLNNQNALTFPTVSPIRSTDGFTTTTPNQQGQRPSTTGQGYQKPVGNGDKEINNDVTSTTKKSDSDDEPLFVPLDPDSYTYGGDHIMVNSPKREAQKDTTKAPLKENEEEFPIDIRFGDK